MHRPPGGRLSWILLQRVVTRSKGDCLLVTAYGLICAGAILAPIDGRRFDRRPVASTASGKASGTRRVMQLAMSSKSYTRRCPEAKRSLRRFDFPLT